MLAETDALCVLFSQRIFSAGLLREIDIAPGDPTVQAGAAMFSDALASHLRTTLSEVEAAGLYKRERLIDSTQNSIVRLKDGRIVSDFPTDEDPVHREFLSRAAVAAQVAAEKTAARDLASSAALPAGATT